jgi:hypothetical protein
MPDMIEARLHKLGKQLPGRLSIPGDLTANKNSFFIHFALRELCRTITRSADCCGS